MWKRGVFGTLALAFLGYVLWFALLSPARHRIEWDIATRVNEVLERTGVHAVMPIVEGRDVELEGEVPSEAEAVRVERIVRNLRGVRVVRSRLVIAAKKKTPRRGGKT